MSFKCGGFVVQQLGLVKTAASQEQLINVVVLMKSSSPCSAGAFR